MVTQVLSGANINKKTETIFSFQKKIIVLYFEKIFNNILKPK